MTKRVTKELVLPALFMQFDTLTKPQLHNLFVKVVQTTGINPSVFKIPILATLACSMKEPIPDAEGKPGKASDNINDYLAAAMGVLDQFGQLTDLLVQLSLLNQAMAQLKKAQEDAKAAQAKKAEEEAQPLNEIVVEKLAEEDSLDEAIAELSKKVDE